MIHCGLSTKYYCTFNLANRDFANFLQDSPIVIAFPDRTAIATNQHEMLTELSNYASMKGDSYVTAWTHDIENVLRRIMCDSYGEPIEREQHGWTLHFAKKLRRMSYGRISVRSIDSWVDTTVTELSESFCNGATDEMSQAISYMRFAKAIDPICKTLGAPMTGSSGSTALQIWRNKWSKRSFASLRFSGETEDMDWCRRAFRGGRVEKLTKHSLVYNDISAVPERLYRHSRKTDMKLYRIDMCSAYPYYMSGRLPFTGGKRGVHWSDDVMDIDNYDGIAECWIEINTAGPRVLAVRIPNTRTGDMSTVFPLGGKAHGVWTYSVIREVLANGGKLISVDRFRTFHYSSFIFKDFCHAIHRTKQHITNPVVKASIGRMPTRLYGKTGSSRMRTMCDDRLPMMNALGDTAVSGFGIFGIANVEQTSYPYGSNPVLSAEISSRCHIGLGKMIHRIEAMGGLVIQCHTDSIIFASDRSLDEIGVVPSGAMGTWRQDWTGDWVCCLGSQCVIMQGFRYSVSGIPKDALGALIEYGESSFKRNTSIMEQIKYGRKGTVDQTVRLSHGMDDRDDME